MKRRLGASIAFCAGLAALAWSVIHASKESRSEAQVPDPTTIGIRAVEHPEAALVDSSKSDQSTKPCSGALIAPKVVLTAAQCVCGYASWNIIVPYNGNQKRHAASATAYECGANPSAHDVGLVFLDVPIEISAPQCPVLARTPIKSGSDIINIGRAENGDVSTSDLFVGPSTPVIAIGSKDSAFVYEAMLVIEQGDFGGPVEVPGTTPHLIAAVNSGSANDVEVLARVDVVNDWIGEQLASHGGACKAAALVAR